MLSMGAATFFSVCLSFYSSLLVISAGQNEIKWNPASTSPSNLSYCFPLTALYHLRGSFHSQVACTILYVAPFYLSSATRPSASLSRDAPSVIRARIRIVTVSTIVSTFFAIYLLSVKAHLPALTILHQLGLYPLIPLAIAKGLFLTALLFAGPLFEKGVIDSGWRTWTQGSDLRATLSNWIGWRNYIAGPLTEEITFRSLLLAVHTSTEPTISIISLIFSTPLYFGFAHIHHLYEFTLTHPFTPLLPAVIRSLLQFAYTTIFGWYATFVFLRTGSLWNVVLIHAGCNWLGLPRFWGRVGGVEVQVGVTEDPIKGSKDINNNTSASTNHLGAQWTIAYYAILVGGIVAWWKGLWVLTESKNALVDFP